MNILNKVSLAALVVVLSSAGLLNAASIKVAQVSTGTTITHSDKTAPATTASSVVQGDVVATDAKASALLALPNGTLVTVAPGSRVGVEQFVMQGTAKPVAMGSLKGEPSQSKTILKLYQGSISGQTQKLKAEAGSYLKIETPAGTVNITGSTWVVTVVRTATGYSVTFQLVSGSGYFTPAAGAAPIVVPAGSSLTIEVTADSVIPGIVKPMTPEEKAAAEAAAAAARSVGNGVVFQGTVIEGEGQLQLPELPKVTGIEGTILPPPPPPAT